MSVLDAELHRVFGDPLVAPRAVMRVQVAAGQGLAAGREEADRFADAGAEMVVLDCDVVPPHALAALAVLQDLDPVAVVGTTPYDGWRDDVLAVRALVRELKPQGHDPEALAADPVLGRVTGLLQQLAERQTVVLLGGGTTTLVGALLAQLMLPGAERWWLAGSRPAGPAGRTACKALGLTPLLDLGLTTGSADLAVALVRTALEQRGA